MDISVKWTLKFGPCLSLLTLYLTLYKTDISVKQTPRVGPCLSLLTLSLTLYKTDISLKQTPRVGPCLSLLTLYLTLYKMDISLRWTLLVIPKGVHLIACGQALLGAMAAGQEKEGELATMSLNF